MDPLVVDLGTCHTVAVLRRAGQPPRALLFDGSPLLPSGVYRAPDGTVSVGRDAERLAMLDPSRFEPYPKRCVDDGGVLLGDADVPVTDLFAALLRRVAGEAGDAAGPVVLTCPADWGPRRREVLLAGARAAGLGEVRLVDEPVAAATYCVEVLRQPVAPGQSLLVFDFGGGTLDVTVMRRRPAGWQVLATGGLDDLGGVDIDAALVGHLGQLLALRAPDAWRRLAGPRTTGELRDRRAFWDGVRVAKEMLSRVASAPVQVPGADDALHLTREELERVAGPLVDRAVDETRRVLDRAGLGSGGPGAGAPGLAGILLVGGSSRMPLVASRLHARFGVAPTVPEQPELPVAYGALLVAPVPVPVSPPVGVFQPALAGPAPNAQQRAWAPLPPPPLPPRPVSPPPAPVPKPARPWWRVPLAIAVALVVVAVLGFGGTTLVRSFLHNGPSRGGGNTGATQTGGSKPGGLTEVTNKVTVQGTAKYAVTAGSDAFYYASVVSGQVSVVAVGLDGKQKWQRNVVANPADVAVRVVGNLLLVDARKSATDAGKDIRFVLSTQDGQQISKTDWTHHTDVAYFGTDAIVSVSDPYQTERVDLTAAGTAKVKWRHNAPADVIIAHDRVLPARTWVESASPAAGAPVAYPAPVGAFVESFGADPNLVVELNSEAGGAVVLDGGGKVKASGNVPLDDEKWTAFDNQAIGKLSDDSAVATVAGYDLGSLKQKWHNDFDPGDDVDAVRPCGQHLVCVAYTRHADDKHVMQAYSTVDGKPQWKNPKAEDFSVDPWCYVFGGILVYGDGTFPDSMLGGPQEADQRLNPADGTGVPLGTNEQSPSLMAGLSHYGVFTTTGLVNNNVGWFVWLVDLSQNQWYGPLSVGSDRPEAYALVGNTLATIGKADRLLHIARQSPPR